MPISEPSEKDAKVRPRIRLRADSVTLEAHPDLARELDDPDYHAHEIPQYSNVKVWWRCPACHRHFDQVVANRVRFRQGCPFCSGRRRIPGPKGNTLAVLHPELAAQWHPTLNAVTPWDVAPNSTEKFWWWIPEIPTRRWQATPASRVRTPRDPWSRGFRADEHNCLRTTHPEVAAQFIGPVERSTDSPDTVTAGCNREMRWRCEDNPEHTWEAVVYSRVEGSGCPICKTLTSGEERACFREIARHVPGLVYGTGSGTAHLQFDFWPRPVDALIPATEGRKDVVLEYDGAFWHANSARADRRKATTFRKRGFLVVRIRRAPLEPLHPDDVQVPPSINAEHDASIIVAHLKRIDAIGT